MVPDSRADHRKVKEGKFRYNQIKNAGHNFKYEKTMNK